MLLSLNRLISILNLPCDTQFLRDELVTKKLLNDYFLRCFYIKTTTPIKELWFFNDATIDDSLTE